MGRSVVTPATFCPAFPLRTSARGSGVSARLAPATQGEPVHPELVEGSPTSLGVTENLRVRDDCAKS